MSDNEFSKGNISYTVTCGVSPEALADLLSGVWKGGYVAFANGERRLDQLGGSAIDAALLSRRVQELPDRLKEPGNTEGYVTEIDLWRQEGAVLEEIAVERKENSFTVQHWRLNTTPADAGNCLYREANTLAGSYRSRLYNGRLATVEVVWPDQRLNFFITRGN